MCVVTHLYPSSILGRQLTEPFCRNMWRSIKCSLPGLSDQRPSLIEAHGLLFGSFLPNRSPWASIWCKHCYEVLARNCQIKAHGPVFGKPWLRNGQSKIIVGKIIAIQVVKKHNIQHVATLAIHLFCDHQSGQQNGHKVMLGYTFQYSILMNLL